MLSERKWKLLSHVRFFVTPWNSPGQNTGVGNLSLLQGIFPTQGLNPGFLHCRRILYQLSHKASPRILEWVAYPFSSRSSRPRNRNRVSCIAGGFFTNWAIREAFYKKKKTALIWLISIKGPIYLSGYYFFSVLVCLPLYFLPYYH